MSFNSFEEMLVWQKAMDLSARIHALTEGLLRKEDYGLTSQVRNSALSVSGNIAERFGRKHTKDKLKFYYNSRGSLAETKSHMVYGSKVMYFEEREFKNCSTLIDEVWRELNALINSMSKKP